MASLTSNGSAVPAATAGILLSQQAPEDQMVLAAVRAVYENDEAEAVRDLLEARIANEAQQLVRTVKRNSRKVEYEVGKLLRARQDIHDMEDRLLAAREQAQQLAQNVESKQHELQEQVQISANIVKVVRLIQVLKRMMRVYGEGREYVKELKLHMAIKTVDALRSMLHDELGIYSIKELDAEAAAFIPDPGVLEGLVEQKCDAMFDKWVTHVIAIHKEIGHHAISQNKTPHSTSAWLPPLLEDAEGSEESATGIVSASVVQLDVRNVVQCGMLYADLGRTKKLESAYANMMQFLTGRALVEARQPHSQSASDKAGHANDYNTLVTLFNSVLGVFIIDCALREQLDLNIVPRARVGKLWLDAERALSECVGEVARSELSLVSRSRLKSFIGEVIACASLYQLGTPTLTEVDRQGLARP